MQLLKFLETWIKKPIEGFKKRLPNSFPYAVSLAGWLGLRTQEAIDLTFKNISTVPPSHKEARFDRPSAKVVIPKCKTGTETRPGRVVFFTRFHPGVDGCPFKSYEDLLKLRKENAKKIKHNFTFRKNIATRAMQSLIHDIIE